MTVRGVISLFLLCFAASAHAQLGAPNGEWPAIGGDKGYTKYAPLDQINRDNVADLQVAWRWRSPDNAIQEKLNSAARPAEPMA
jgi:glucose dehydrogenase